MGDGHSGALGGVQVGKQPSRPRPWHFTLYACFPDWAVEVGTGSEMHISGCQGPRNYRVPRKTKKDKHVSKKMKDAGQENENAMRGPSTGS